MIKIKKIQLQNFKGIYSKTEFSFDLQDVNVNIMSGPNGFGKTTIFDVIELCITGEFKRIELFKDVQKKNNNKNKPFFQNTDGEDVILKLWLNNTSTEEDYIIIKNYSDQFSPKNVKHARNFIPDDGNKIFNTYLTNNIDFFDSDDFSTLENVQQQNINQLFYGEGTEIDLSSIYYLFNYIQQEDSIYFLKKNEDDKGASLGFLFNIEKEERDKQKIQLIRDNYQSQSNRITDQISLLKDALPNAESSQFLKLFPTKEYEFDAETPFVQIDSVNEKLNQFEQTISTLIDFRSKFIVSEFEKSIKFKKLNEDILSKNELLNAILLKKVYSEDLFAELNMINSKIINAKKIIELPETSIFEKQYFEDFHDIPKDIVAYALIENNIKLIDFDLGEIGKIISDINIQREQILIEFTKIKDTVHVQENNCPLCDANFESFEKLNESISKKSEIFTAYSNDKIEQKTQFQNQLKVINLKITTAAKKYVEETKVTDEEVLAIYRSYPTIKEKVDEFFQTYIKLDENELDVFLFQITPSTLLEISEKQILLKNYLQGKLLAELQFNELQIENKQFYIEYFDSNSDFFESITAEMLNDKLSYLKWKLAVIANERLSFLENRNEKLNKLLIPINKIVEGLHRKIQDHKAEMIRSIQIPFYIYSGKILQSYQQGLGIFIEIHQTGQSNNVRFKTGNSSDHDIVYHLSSGQMAVVSLAFCLSLNKVYNTNEHFKFLAIDDPIQTMDDLNIHTFIELIRNEFSEYQLIFSTHDDFTSRYMKYKFDKYNMITEIQNIQEIVMEQTFE